MTKEFSMDFDYWMGDECELIEDIKKLKGIDISDHKEVTGAIEILEALDTNLYGLLIVHEVLFDETRIATILKLYRESIDILKVHEGVDFQKTQAAYRTSLRLIQLMVGLLYDAFNQIGAMVPKTLQELI